MVYLTGERTWFAIVEVANELLAYDRLSKEELANAIGDALVTYYDLRHEVAFANGLQSLQPTRDLMLSKGSEPIANALDKAM